MRKAVFITGRFRSGSTLLWNLFRQALEAHAYYEPLHEQLIEWIKLDIPPQSRHYFVDSYFKEFRGVGQLVRYHRNEFGVYRLYLESGDTYPALKAYFDYLIAYAPPDKTVVLKENRIDFRLPWIKLNFPQIPLIHLYRSVRDQWISSIVDFPGGVDRDLDSNPYFITTWSRDLFRQFPFLASPFIRHSYQRHYYLWKLSYLLGSQFADFSLAYEELLMEPEKYIKKLLGFGGLDTQSNIEKCLKILVIRPFGIWKDYRSAEWFADLEEECEEQLTELGLNANFGKKPLDQIIAESPGYQRFLADERVSDWAVNSSQAAIVRLKNEAAEKENVIQAQQRELQAREKNIQSEKSDLEAKEKIIQGFRASYSYWLVHGPLRSLPYLRPLVLRLRAIRNFFIPKV